MPRPFKLALIGVILCFFYSCRPTTQELLDRGSAAFDAGRYREAIDIYTRLLKTKPKIQTARFNRSLCYAALKNYPRAIIDLNSIMNDQIKGDAVIFINPELPFSSEETRNGVYYFEALQQRALFYFSMDSLRLAFKDFQDCIDHDYQVGPSYLWQGDIYRAVGKKEKACALYEKAKWLADPTADSLVRHYCNE